MYIAMVFTTIIASIMQIQSIIKYDSTYVIVGINMEKMATKFYAPQYTP